MLAFSRGARSRLRFVYPAQCVRGTHYLCYEMLMPAPALSEICSNRKVSAKDSSTNPKSSDSAFDDEVHFSSNRGSTESLAIIQSAGDVNARLTPRKRKRLACVDWTRKQVVQPWPR